MFIVVCSRHQCLEARSTIFRYIATSFIGMFYLLLLIFVFKLLISLEKNVFEPLQNIGPTLSQPIKSFLIASVNTITIIAHHHQFNG
jgi:hypothetical protein